MNNIHASSPMHIRELASDAIAYWERRRIAYNVVLAVVFGACVIGTWPKFAPIFVSDEMLLIYVLAVLANACYCAAYPVDLFVQTSLFRGTWRGKRWMLWLLGTLFAATLTYFWSMNASFAGSRLS